MSSSYDAIVIGAGPNGLAAAIEVARAGRSVLVVEAEETVGGGTRSAELTLPGFIHDVCSAIHPLGLASPFFRGFPAEKHGLEWVHPQIPLAHPLGDGRVGLLQRSVEETAQGLGRDGGSYARMMKPLVRNYKALLDEFLGPLRPPRHPLVMARFGLQALRSARGLADARFKDDAAKALFAGMAAHSMLPMNSSPTAAFGLMLGTLGHAIGWPAARGGSGSIPDALSAYLRSLGGEIKTGTRVESIEQLPDARLYLFDVTPRQLIKIAGTRLGDRYRRRLERYRYGPGIFKVDWALDGPIPWKDEVCSKAGTVHLGGTIDELTAAEDEVHAGRIPERPYVLLSQQSMFDPSRAPDGKHTIWAYCHVPHGSDVDMTARIEDQIERFAPGFKDLILAKSVKDPAEMQRHNANYIGGDINGGVQDLRQLFTRPVARIVPYSTPNPQIYLCSSSTPPGGGVHGMCGYWAAHYALRRAF